MVAWNPQIFIFGWCEDFIMGISSKLTVLNFGYFQTKLTINNRFCYL